MDTLSILKSIVKINVYTKPSSIHFDRHHLSEREENKFNSEFSIFLKQMIEHMNDADIEYKLEYFVRVFSIDTFNPKEYNFSR